MNIYIYIYIYIYILLQYEFEYRTGYIPNDWCRYYIVWMIDLVDIVLYLIKCIETFHLYNTNCLFILFIHLSFFLVTRECISASLLVHFD